MLIEPHTMARATDPATSHAAAEHVTRTGKAASQRAVVLAAVTEHPGLTSFELAAHCRLDRFQIARRLPEIERLGTVIRGRPRVCTVSRMKAATWWVQPVQLELVS